MFNNIYVQRIMDANNEMPEADLIKYKAELEDMVATFEGTVPGSRGFGLDNNYVDETPEDIANDMIIDLQNKCAEFIPELRVDAIGVVEADEHGNLGLSITIELKEEE